MDLLDRPFPQAIEAERALLGGLLQRPEQLDAIAGTLEPSDLYRGEHRALLAVMLEMHTAGESIDLVTVSERITRGDPEALRFGGVAYVVELPEAIPSTANLEHYATLVRRKSAQREVIRASRHLAEAAYLDDTDPETLLATAATQLQDAQRSGADGWKTAEQVQDATFEHIHQASEGLAVPLSVGLLEVDDRLAGGLRPEDLVVIGGAPGSGKTAFAMHLARHLSHMQGANGAVISLEMSDARLGLRLLAAETGVQLHDLLNGRLEPHQWARLEEAREQLSVWPLHVWDPPSSSAAVALSKVRQLHRQRPLEWILLDYITLLDPPQGATNLGEATRSNSNALRAFAKEMGIVVIALAQLNDAWEKRGEGSPPLLSDFAGSKQIGRDATAAGILERHGSEGVLHLVKSRDGTPGPCGFDCDLSRGRFFDQGDLL